MAYPDPTDIGVDTDAIIKVDDAGTWSLARESPTGSAEIPATGGANLKKSGNGGKWDLYRYFAAIDTSGITCTPVSGSLKLYGKGSYMANNIRIIKVPGSAVGNSSTAFVDRDFDQTSSTAYSDEFPIDSVGWSNSGYNEIPLNNLALCEMTTLDEFKFAVIVEADFDNAEGTTSTLSGPGWEYKVTGDPAERPKISYVPAPGWQCQTATGPILKSDFTIDSYNNTSKTYNKEVEQVPFIFGVPGPLSLKQRAQIGGDFCQGNPTSRTAIIKLGKKKT
jgi:hypothetical protein